MRFWNKRGIPISAKVGGPFASLDDFQERFAEALCHGDETTLMALDAVMSKDEVTVFTERFAVYRNNVYYSLSQALRDTYPVVNRLVGEAFFSAMARAYLDSGNLPTHAPLYDFGSLFPEFVDGFAPAKGLPWLGDVARVEQVWLHAYHGADAPGGIVYDESFMLGNDGEKVAHMSLLLHPSLEMAVLNWPAVEIWQAHQQPDTEKRLGKLSVSEQKNFVVAVRGKLEEVRLASLPGCAGEILERLLAGNRVFEAARGTNENVVRVVLETLVGMGAVLGLKEA